MSTLDIGAIDAVFVGFMLPGERPFRRLISLRWVPGAVDLRGSAASCQRAMPAWRQRSCFRRPPHSIRWRRGKAEPVLA
jgi:hypothetical protein